MQLLEAAPSLRDKLLLGLMYATGMRVSAVCRLKWKDLDFDRRVVNIWEGKGRTDRQVMLPLSFEPLLRELSKTFHPGDYVFPGERTGRHLSPRSAGRAMERAVKIANLFYQLLQAHVTRKYLSLPPAASATARASQPQPAIGPRPPILPAVEIVRIHTNPKRQRGNDLSPRWCVTFYYPLIVVEMWLGTMNGIGCEPMWKLSGADGSGR